MLKLSQILKIPFYRQSNKLFWVMVGCILACKLSWGVFGFLIVAACLQATQTNKPAKALICFSLLPFFTILNPSVFGLGGLLSMSARLGTPLMAMAMLAASGQRRGRMTIPLVGLLIYVVAAIPSSMFGYSPLISFMKLVNFFFFVLGIYAGTKNLDNRPQEVEKLRVFFFTFSFFIVVGSMLLYLVGHGSGGAQTLRESISTAGYGGGFLCGVVNHSQCLGPTTAVIAGWVLADMLFVEKCMMPVHVLILMLSPVVLYLTQSRTSLVAFVAEIGVITIYCLPKFRVPVQLKRRIGTMLRTGLVLLVLAAAVLQVTSGGMKKWLVKHSDADEEVSIDTLTSSRQNLIDESMDDFRQNPFFGKGFQVSYQYEGVKVDLFSLSAPIEKGFMPAMILGETGVLGLLAFIAFLAMFYSGCRNYLVTLALFFTFLVTNLGEATFFSPGGTGGPEWLICAAGGFVIDAAVLIRRRTPRAAWHAESTTPMKVMRRMPVVRRRMPDEREQMPLPPDVSAPSNAGLNTSSLAETAAQKPPSDATQKTETSFKPQSSSRASSGSSVVRPESAPSIQKVSSRTVRPESSRAIRPESSRAGRPITAPQARPVSARTSRPSMDYPRSPVETRPMHRPHGEVRPTLGAVEKRILVLGGSSTHDFVVLMEPYLLDQGIRPVFCEKSFARFAKDAANGRLASDGFRPDVVFVMTSSWNIKNWPALDETAESVDQLVDETMVRFETLWMALANTFRCPVIQNNFEYLPYRLLGNLDEADVYGRICHINRLNDCILDWAERHRGFFINDINRQSSDFGLSNWHDLAYWCLFRYAMSKTAMPVAASNVANLVYDALAAGSRPTRCPPPEKRRKKWTNDLEYA